MGNCLATKLKESVDNEALCRMGEMELNVKAVQNPTYMTQFLNVGYNSYMYGSEIFNLRIVGDGYFSNTVGGESIGKTVTLSASKESVFVSNGNYKIFIDNKYKIKCVTGAMLRSMNLNDFKYLPALQFIAATAPSVQNTDYYAFDSVDLDINTLPQKNLWYCSTTTCRNVKLDLNGTLPFSTINLGNLSLNSKVSGNISVLNTYTGLTTLGFGGIQTIEGSIASLGNLTKVGNISFNGCINIGGRLEDLCVALLNNGKTSGVLNIDIQNTSATVHDVPSPTFRMPCTFGSDTITIAAGGTTYATYSNGEWSY